MQASATQLLRPSLHVFPAPGLTLIPPTGTEGHRPPTTPLRVATHLQLGEGARVSSQHNCMQRSTVPTPAPLDSTWSAGWGMELGERCVGMQECKGT